MASLMSGDSGASDVGTDPFTDSAAVSAATLGLGETTLSVGRNATLTLGTDSLIVLDEEFVGANKFDCCGLFDRSKPTKAIPYFNVLWAQSSATEITINYARPISNDSVSAATLNYTFDHISRDRAKKWAATLLDKAYGSATRNKRIKVLINPFGGQGYAPKQYVRDIEPILAAARCDIDVEKTQYNGHAVEIAEKLNIQNYDIVACCSGDGLPHEVFNGLAKKPNAVEALSKIAVVQLPCGSGNAMSWNTFGTGSTSLAAVSLVKGLEIPLDLISVTQGDNRTMSFLSQSVGIVAESDLATEHVRWMGDLRFTYGFLVRILGKTVYPCDMALKIEINDKPSIKEHYQAQRKTEAVPGEFRPVRSSSTSGALPPLKYGTINDPLPSDWKMVPYDKLGNFYSGNMAYMAANANFFPASLPHDGCLDLVTIDGDISRMTAFNTMLAVEKGTFFDLPHVSLQKVSAYRLVPKQKDGYISIDGEKIPFKPFQAEVHRGLGTTLSKNGHCYEAKGPGE